MKYGTIKKHGWRLASVLAAAMLFAACNDEKSNSSETPPTTENNVVTEPETGNPVTSDTGSGNTVISPPATSTTGRTSGRTGKATVGTETVSRTDKMAADKTGYYNYAEVSPSFKNGQRGIENYVNNHIEYPQEAIDNNIEGTVNVRFGIDENGNVSNVTTLGNKIGYGLEEEAVRVIKDMSKWTPGMVKGKNVKTWMVLPITYKIDGL